MSIALDTGRHQRFAPLGGMDMDGEDPETRISAILDARDAFDEELEEQVADVIDELWDRYAHDEWLLALVEEERGGEILEKIARRVVEGEHPDVVVFAMHFGVELDAT